MIIDFIMAQKKKGEGVVLVKFDLKIVFSLPASVRDTLWFYACLVNI